MVSRTREKSFCCLLLLTMYISITIRMPFNFHALCDSCSILFFFTTFLYHYCIRSIVIKWLSEEPLIYGVPQGSILGAILFTIYISNLPEISKLYPNWFIIIIDYAVRQLLLFLDLQSKRGNKKWSGSKSSQMGQLQRVSPKFEKIARDIFTKTNLNRARIYDHK